MSASAGCPVTSIQKFLGYKKLNTTMVYAHAHDHTVEADCHADPQQVAISLISLAYRMRICNLPDGQSALQFTRNQLDRLGIGQAVKEIPWGSKCFKLPPSHLTG